MKMCYIGDDSGEVEGVMSDGVAEVGEETDYGRNIERCRGRGLRGSD